MKKTKRASHFLKQYFVFSKTERKGIYVLLALIFLAVSSPYLYRLVFPAQPIAVQLSELSAASVASSVSDSSNQLTNTVIKADAKPQVLVPFNPNTADSVTLSLLGFTAKNVKSILNYRQKGGKFRQPTDLYKLYHVDSQLVAQLIPLVRLDEGVTNKYPTKTYAPYQPKIKAVVELNTADSVALVSLYGIGPKMASKIITYRNEVGGFFTVNQLTEIWGFDPLLIDELIGKVTVDVSQVRYLRINQVSYEELKKHPYLRFKQAAAVVNYRRQHGPFTSAQELKKVLIIPDSTCRKLEPYLRFD
jgi:competence protein ComEA